MSYFPKHVLEASSIVPFLLVFYLFFSISQVHILHILHILTSTRFVLFCFVLFFPFCSSTAVLLCCGSLEFSVFPFLFPLRTYSRL